MSKFKDILKAHQGESEPKAEVIQAKTPPSKKEKSTAKQHRPKGKRSHPDYTQVSAYIPKELHRQIKIALLEENNQEFSDLLTELLTDWLKQK